MTDTPIVLWSG